MNTPFEVQLERIKGQVRVIDLANQFERRSNSLMYYWNYADELHEAAILVSKGKLISGNVFCLLAGLSIELLLKGILLGLTEKFPKTHNLLDLSQKAGIALSNDEQIILLALSEYVSWASKYPTPKDEQSWNSAQQLFQQQRNSSGKLGGLYIVERQISVENYNKSWDKYSSCFWCVHEVLF